MNAKKTTERPIALLAVGVIVFVAYHVISNRQQPSEAARPTSGGGGSVGLQPNRPAKPPPSPEAALKNRQAREALRLVGADTEAEKVWIQAINDPILSANDRQNLIEDLNEEGFSNGKQATVADLPLIASRLKLIEELMPFAMDDVNAAAFKEARKDLLEMHRRLSSQ